MYSEAWACLIFRGLLQINLYQLIYFPKLSYFTKIYIAKLVTDRDRFFNPKQNVGHFSSFENEILSEKILSYYSKHYAQKNILINYLQIHILVHRDFFTYAYVCMCRCLLSIKANHYLIHIFKIFIIKFLFNFKVIHAAKSLHKEFQNSYFQLLTCSKNVLRFYSFRE